MLILCMTLFFVTSCLAENLESSVTKRSASDYEIFEGDIMLPKEEIEAIKKGQDPDSVGGARGLRKNRNWPGGIVYYTIDTRRPIRRAIIHSAIREWEEFTCIRFKEKTMSYQKDYIEFFVGKGCYSTGVGRQGGKQKISLGFGCITHGIAVHEIGHALGLYHEQSRPDRDNYVKINWENIQKGTEHNFYKHSHYSIDSLGVPYDYDSIMHYGKREFAWPPWKVTIETKQKGASIGQRRHLSKLDRKQMNLLYKCNRK